MSHRAKVQGCFGACSTCWYGSEVDTYLCYISEPSGINYCKIICEYVFRATATLEVRSDIGNDDYNVLHSTLRQISCRPCLKCRTGARQYSLHCMCDIVISDESKQTLVLEALLDEGLYDYK